MSPLAIFTLVTQMRKRSTCRISSAKRRYVQVERLVSNQDKKKTRWVSVPSFNAPAQDNRSLINRILPWPTRTPGSRSP